MVGFSHSVSRLSSTPQWINSKIGKSKKKPVQIGAGKISKKRSATIEIQKPKKSSKKVKKHH